MVHQPPQAGLAGLQAHSGRTRICTDFIVDWQPTDIFVAPSWKHVSHEVSDEAVLFSFSDRPIQEALNLFREESGDA